MNARVCALFSASNGHATSSPSGRAMVDSALRLMVATVERYDGYAGLTRFIQRELEVAELGRKARGKLIAVG